MKNFFLKSFAVMVAAILFTSCASGLTGVMGGSATLSMNNFEYVEQNIQGMSKATYVLGVGGMKKEAIVNEAKQNMLRNNPLKNGQALANLSVDFKHSTFLGIVNTVKCYVTADVVEFK